MDVLKSVGDAITRLPEDFTPHRQIKKVYEARRAMIESGEARRCMRHAGGRARRRAAWLARLAGYIGLRAALLTARRCLSVHAAH